MKKPERELIFNKYNGRCAYCGADITQKDMQVDHVIPQCNFLGHIRNRYKIPTFLNHLTIDDLNHFDNLFPTCRVCNKWKSAHCLDTFRGELNEQVKRLNNYSSNFRIAKRYGLVKEEMKPIVFYFETINKEFT